MYSLVCKSEPKHLISIELERLHTLEKEDVANVHLHRTTHIVSVEEYRVSDVPAGHLCSTYRQYSLTHTYIIYICTYVISIHTYIHTYIHTCDCRAALRNVSKDMVSRYNRERGKPSMMRMVYNLIIQCNEYPPLHTQIARKYIHSMYLS